MERLHRRGVVGLALAAAVLVAAPAKGAESPVAQAQRALDAGDLEKANAIITPWVREHPDDEEARFMAGRLASWRKRYQEATAMLAPLVIKRPDNADYVAALARNIAWSGDVVAALPLIDRARVLNPADFDIWVLEIRSLEGLGGVNLAAAARLRAEATQRFPDRPLPPPPSPAPTSPPAASPGPGTPRGATTSFQPAYQVQGRWHVEAAGEGEWLSRGLAPWSGSSIEATRFWTPRQRMWTRLRETIRFDKLDLEAAVGGASPLRHDVVASGELTASPTNQVLPIASGHAQVAWTPQEGISTDARLRAAVYRLAVVPSAALGVERYLGLWRAGYSLLITGAPDATFPLVHMVSGSFYPRDDVSLTLGGALGEEVETIAPLKVARTGTRSVWFTGRVPLVAGWWAKPEVAWIDQTAFFSRLRARLGLELRF